MISRISLLKCKEGVSEEAFREGMMGDVRDVIARMPQLRKCEIDFVTDRQQRSHLGRGAIDIDGFIEMFFDSYGDMQQAMDEAGDALLAALEPLVEEPVSTLVGGHARSRLPRRQGYQARVFLRSRGGRRCRDVP